MTPASRSTGSTGQWDFRPPLWSAGPRPGQLRTRVRRVDLNEMITRLEPASAGLGSATMTA